MYASLYSLIDELIDEFDLLLNCLNLINMICVFTKWWINWWISSLLNCLSNMIQLVSWNGVFSEHSFNDTIYLSLTQVAERTDFRNHTVSYPLIDESIDELIDEFDLLLNCLNLINMICAFTNWWINWWSNWWIWLIVELLDLINMICVFTNWWINWWSNWWIWIIVELIYLINMICVFINWWINWWIWQIVEVLEFD